MYMVVNLSRIDAQKGKMGMSSTSTMYCQTAFQGASMHLYFLQSCLRSPFPTPSSKSVLPGLPIVPHLTDMKYYLIAV